MIFVFQLDSSFIRFKSWPNAFWFSPLFQYKIVYLINQKFKLVFLLLSFQNAPLPCHFNCKKLCFLFPFLFHLYLGQIANPRSTGSDLLRLSMSESPTCTVQCTVCMNTNCMCRRVFFCFFSERRFAGSKTWRPRLFFRQTSGRTGLGLFLKLASVGLERNSKVGHIEGTNGLGCARDHFEHSEWGLNSNLSVVRFDGRAPV